MSPRRHRIARTQDLDGQGPHAVSVDGHDLVLLRVDGRFTAFDGLCPHQGALLGEGELDGGVLTCRNHRWRFDTRTGERIGGPQCLRQHHVCEVRGHLEVELCSGEPKPEASTAGTRDPDDLPGPRAWPVVGNALQLDADRVHQTLEGWARIYGSVYRMHLGRRFVVVTEPALIAEVLRRRPQVWRRIDRMEQIFGELGIDGVFSSEGASWRAQRKLAMGALNQRHLVGFFPVLREVTERLRQRWAQAADAGEVIDVPEQMMRFTVDVTTRLAFSQPTDAVGGAHSDLLENLAPIFPGVSRRLNAAVPYWRYFKLARDRQLEESMQQVRSWLERTLAHTRAVLEAEPERAERPGDFLEAMLVARDPQGRPFSDRLLFGNALTMLLAGEDTTANTVAWAVHFLLDHPEELRRLREHVDEVLGDAQVPADIPTASALDQIEDVANETLRLEPVAPLMFMENISETTLGDLRLPPATAVCVLLRVASLDPEWIEDPLSFRPERWRHEHTAAQMQRAGVCVPFGSGPRICPGRSLALLEIRLALATLLRNFEIERVGRSEDVKELFTFTLTPTNLRVRLRRREQSPSSRAAG